MRQGIRYWEIKGLTRKIFNESKWALEKERAQAVDSFREKYVHGNVMEADFEAMLNAIWDDDYEAHVLMFLYGAGEREKMLS